MKFDIRTSFISLSTEINRERDRVQKELTSRMEELTDISDLSQAEFEEFNGIKRELAAFQKGIERAKLFRSKRDWAMYGGKSSKFFLNLEKNKYIDKLVTQLFNEEGELITDQKGILEVEKEFYRKLYSKKVDFSDLPDHFSSEDTGFLQPIDKEFLDADFTVDELEAALMGMSPGSDGFSVEFYRKFWKHLADILLDCTQDIFDSGHLTNEQQRGIITLIPKKNKGRCTSLVGDQLHY